MLFVVLNLLEKKRKKGEKDIWEGSRESECAPKRGEEEKLVATLAATRSRFNWSSKRTNFARDPNWTSLVFLF